MTLWLVRSYLHFYWYYYTTITTNSNSNAITSTTTVNSGTKEDNEYHDFGACDFVN